MAYTFGKIMKLNPNLIQVVLDEFLAALRENLDADWDAINPAIKY
jgi:hypothetical protein